MPRSHRRSGSHARSAQRPGPLLTARGFTLIELIAVVVLLAIAVGLVTIRMDSFTSRGRVRSAANQIAAIHELARIEALGSGEPRRLVFDSVASACRLQKPEQEARSWRWSDGRTLHWIHGVVVRRIECGSDETLGTPVVRVASDGTSPRWAALLASRQEGAALLVDARGARCTLGVDAAAVDLESLWEREP